MSLDSSFLDKIDPQLQEKLAYAPENEILRVIVRLSGENKSNINSKSINLADSPNRTEYRKALIAQRQQQLSGDIGETKRAIENLALKTYGGINTKTLVVEGTANQILHSLELSGIESATLDQGFSPIVPNPHSSPNNLLESIFLAIAETANIIKTTRFNRLAKLLGKSDFNQEENTKQLISQASQQYIDKYYVRYGWIKVLGMKNPVSLESIYTNVRLLDESNMLKFTSSEALEQNFRERQSRNFQFTGDNCQPQTGLDVANDKQYLMVLGAPGAGKSTFLRKMGLEALKGRKRKYQHKCIPVFLELKRFTDTEINIKHIEQLITEEFKICGFPTPEKFTTKALEQGRLLILLDGLDEVPTKNLNTVIETIQDFVDLHDRNRFIVSCRIAAYRTNFHRFTDLVMAEFDDQQIEQFIGNWFKSEQDQQTNTAQDCWQLLQQPKNQTAKDLAQTPLLLTFLCLVYDKSQNFPDNRSVLYRKALRILLEEWAAEKRIQRDEIYSGLNTDLEEILLAEISYQGFAQDKLFYDRRDLVGQIKAFLASNLNAPQHLNGEAVLNAIEVQQGILVERLEDVYSFSHLTLQEYLVAQHIVDHNQIQALVKNHLTDTRWKEVFQLVAGLMRSGANELLLLIEKEAQTYLSTPIGKNHLVPLLNWSNTITKKDAGNSHINPVVKRLIALKYALEVTRNYLSYYCNNLHDFTSQYNKCLNLNTNLDNDFRSKYANVQGETFVQALKLVNSFGVSYLSLYGTIAILAKENSNDRSTIIFNSIDLKENNYDYSALAEIERACLEYFIEYSKRFQTQSIDKQIFPYIDFSLLEKHFKQYKGSISSQPRQKNSFSKKEVYEISLGFINKLSEVWFNAFQLTPELLNLSRKEIEEIDSKYFYINSLIIQCKEAAVRVSPETWQGIESRMLLPIKNSH